MKIKAKFKGSDSLGYQHGKDYKLYFICNPDKIYVYRLDHTGTCPYESLYAFEQNWEVLPNEPHNEGKMIMDTEGFIKAVKKD